jgi:hypothetical protein
VRDSGVPYRWAVAIYDRVYQSVHHLDRPEAQVGALRVEICRMRRRFVLPDGTELSRGDRFANLHLNNAVVMRLHTDGLAPVEIGLAFRRELLASLRELARLTAPGQPLADVRAFAATTIFHRGLSRIGFRAERGGMLWPWLVAFYQRALLTTLHPGGRNRLTRSTTHGARRVWMTREALLARFGASSTRRKAAS